MSRLSRLAAPALIISALLLTGCVADDAPAPDAEASTPAPAPTTAVPTPASPTDAVPSGPVLSMTVLPTGCEDMLDDAVLAQLEDIPLNDPSFGESGVLPDRSLRCVWSEPGSQTTRLVTTINYAPEQPVLDYLNVLMADGFVCYEPSGGLRCEATWDNETAPVTDGRTLFYRDGVLIDTQYSNLAPSGYTAAIIRTLWPEG
ncbi:hypothetical protein [Microbacterium invictum]|uniref:DUF3558 domain-containing protein n=1 Tax=Microbacterium invictum TaxID=515415 RepID=A0AA40SQ24_9MICO|nr:MULTISPECIES: hypothetical protein [Microbacterium]MBB4140157.1 hypothetical protein [Microbacterium invictum]